MIIWKVNPGVPLDVNFGVHVVCPAGEWTPIKPNWICTEVIDYIHGALDQGVPVKLMDPSEYVYDSSTMTRERFESILSQCTSQLLLFKVKVIPPEETVA